MANRLSNATQNTLALLWNSLCDTIDEAYDAGDSVDQLIALRDAIGRVCDAPTLTTLIAEPLVRAELKKATARKAFNAKWTTALGRVTTAAWEINRDLARAERFEIAGI